MAKAPADFKTPQDFEEAQGNEIAALQAIFMGDFEEPKTAWKTGQNKKFILHLFPQIEDDVNNRHVSADVEFEFPKRYPISLPTIRIIKSKGLSTAQLKELNSAIDEQIKQMKGRELVFEIAQHIQAFLALHNHERISFYQQMTERQEKERLAKEQEEQQRQQKLAEQAKQEEAKRATLGKQIDENVRRKEEALKEEQRQRKADQPVGDDGASEREVRDLCVYASKKGRAERVPLQVTLMSVIVKGNDFTMYLGLETTTGQLTLVRQMQLSAPAEDAAVFKQLLDVKKEIGRLMGRKEAHVARHHGMRVVEREQGALVEIFTDYFEGGSLEMLLKRCGGVHLSVARDYAGQLLQAMATLHNEKFVIQCVTSDTLFFDGEGRLIIGTVGYVGLLMDLNRKLRGQQLEKASKQWPSPDGVVEWSSINARKSDVWSVGCLLLEMLAGPSVYTTFASANDAIATVCGVEDPLAAADAKNASYVQLRDLLLKIFTKKHTDRPTAATLLQHSFFTTIAPPPTIGERRVNLAATTTATTAIDTVRLALESLSASAAAPSPPSQQAIVPAAAALARPSQLKKTDEVVPPLAASTFSRFRNDFEDATFLGKGGFGSVMRCRNKLDGREYAIKRVKLDRKDTEYNRRYLREVTTLSQLHHEYVVRYYQAWIEGADEDEVSLANSEDEDDEDEEEDADELASKLGDLSMDWLGSPGYITPDARSRSSSFISFEREKNDKNDDDDDDEEEEDEEEEEEDDDEEEEDDDEDEEQEDDDDDDDDEDDDAEKKVVVKSKKPSQLAKTPVHAKPALKKTSPKQQEPVKKRTRLPSDSKSDESAPAPALYLYIQMEFCPNNTLRDVIDAGPIEPDEIWRLFRQIVEGLAYIHSQGLIHRDLKPGNIFLDSKDNVKIGDFGLAVSGHVPSVAADGAGGSIADGSLTTDVGTALYVSPETFSSVSSKGTIKYSHKVDIYSLGIMFFEMCYRFSTGMERVIVLNALRQAEIVFPADFQQERLANHATLIKWMLNHNPKERPTALQLMRSEYLPQRMEDEYINEAVRTVTNPNSPYFSRLLSALFDNYGNQLSDYTYDMDASTPSTLTPYSSYHTSKTLDTIVRVFKHHGAIQLDTPLLMPRSLLHSQADNMSVMDSDGELVTLPYDLTMPFARFLAQTPTFESLRRYSVNKVFRKKNIGGQPLQPRECDFDIVESVSCNMLPDAEVIKVATEVMDAFPPINERGYTIRVSHARVTDAILNECQVNSVDKIKVCSLIAQLSKLTWSQVRKLILSQCSMTSVLVDRLGSLIQIKGDNDTVLLRLRASFASNSSAVAGIDDLVTLWSHLKAFGLGGSGRIVMDPSLMLNSHFTYYDGMMFQVVLLHRNKRRLEVVAAGGRYDRLVSRFRHPTANTPQLYAVGVNFALEKLAANSLPYFSAAQPLPQQKSNDADIFVCSVCKNTSLQQEQLTITSELWAADLHAVSSYGSRIDGASIEQLQVKCRNLGITWMVILTDKYTRVAPVCKVRNITKKTEVDVPRTGLVDYLTRAISSGSSASGSDATIATDSPTATTTATAQSSIHGSNINVQVLLPDSTKAKIVAKRKNMIIEKAYQKFAAVRQQLFGRHAVEVLALDLELPIVRKLLAVDVLSDEAMKPLLDSVQQHRKYLIMIREAMIAARKQRHAFYVLLYGYREEFAELYQFFE